ncbi:DUF6884 domain-containing protein [Streptomyces sp. NPDC055089]
MIIVSCGGSKLATEQPVPAGKMYTGSYHWALRRAANTLTHGVRSARVFVLSALHGLLDLNDLIAPYDLRMGETGSVTSEQVRQQAVDRGILDADVTVLGPRSYCDISRAVWPQMTEPLAGARGIGDQLARLADIYNPTRHHNPQRSTSSDATPGSIIEEIERRADARHMAAEQRAARHRTRFATCSQLIIHHPTRAHGSLTFPGDTAKSGARASATQRFAGLYQVQIRARSDDDRTVDIHGTPRNVARFLSALPRALERTEVRASEAARLYGRWERHSNARNYLAGLTPAQRRARARDFRAAAFEVVVDVLLDPPDTVPEARGGIPPWTQVYPLAAGIAHYYWFDPASHEDPDETARILANADRHHPTPEAAPVHSL